MRHYDAIEKAIESGDVDGLRESVGTLIYTNRDFSNGEFDKTVRYVESKGIQLRELWNGEPRVTDDKTSFEREDFTRAVFDLKNNFCDERIDDVKKIGKALYGQSAPAAAEKKPKETESKKGAGDTDPKASRHQKLNPILVAGIAVLVIIVAVIVVVNLLQN